MYKVLILDSVPDPNDTSFYSFRFLNLYNSDST
jgi:hypothetical protein